MVFADLNFTILNFIVYIFIQIDEYSKKYPIFIALYTNIDIINIYITSH
jgi:hypothetical protein